MPEGELRVDSRTLSIIKQSLCRLVEDEGEVEPYSTRLWPQDMCKATVQYDNLRWNPSLEQTESCLGDIQTLKRVEKGLKLWAENLSNVITMSRVAILSAARRYGMARLPDEIMLLIFEQLLKLHKDPFTGSRIVIRDLSLVSKRFRNLVLTSTELWSYLDLYRCQGDVVDLFIHRSRSKPLSVRFRSTAKTEDSILRALECHERWHYLEATFDDVINGLIDLPSMTFPAVTSLLLDIHDHRPEHHAGLPAWKFPRAQSLELRTEFPPMHALRYECLRSFTKTQQHTLYDTGDEFMAKLTKFLRPAIWLSALHLDVSYYENYEANYLVELPSVDVFSMSNWRDGDDTKFSDASLNPNPMPEEVLARVIKSFVMPNVRNISISMIYLQESCEADFRMADWLPLAFPHEMHSVVSFTLHIMDLSIGVRLFDRVMVELDGLFRRFPTLKCLDLDTGNCDVALGNSKALKTELQHLQSLRINFNGLYLEAFLDSLELIANNCEHLEEVEIQSRTEFDVDFFKSIFAQVRWKHG